MNINCLFEHLRKALHGDFSYENSVLAFGALHEFTSIEESRMALDYVIGHLSRSMGVSTNELKRCLIDLFTKDELSVNKLISAIEQAAIRRKSARFNIVFGGPDSPPRSVVIDAITLLKIRLAWEKIITLKSIYCIRYPLANESEQLKQVYLVLELLRRIKHEP